MVALLEIYPAEDQGYAIPQFTLHFPTKKKRVTRTNPEPGYQLEKNRGRVFLMGDYNYFIGADETATGNRLPFNFVTKSEEQGKYMRGVVSRRHHDTNSLIMAHTDYCKIAENDKSNALDKCGFYKESSDYIKSIIDFNKEFLLNRADNLGKSALRVAEK